jgi:hypothetical protein
MMGSGGELAAGLLRPPVTAPAGAAALRSTGAGADLQPPSPQDDCVTFRQFPPGHYYSSKTGEFTRYYNPRHYLDFEASPQVRGGGGGWLRG